MDLSKTWDHMVSISSGSGYGADRELGALYAATTTVFFPIKRISLNRVWKGISLNRENDIKVSYAGNRWWYNWIWY